MRAQATVVSKGNDGKITVIQKGSNGMICAHNRSIPDFNSPARRRSLREGLLALSRSNLSTSTLGIRRYPLQQSRTGKNS
jgi:hypothetical protein